MRPFKLWEEIIKIGILLGPPQIGEWSPPRTFRWRTQDSRWRPPYSCWRPSDFHWRSPDFHWRPPDYHWRFQDFHMGPLKKMRVSKCKSVGL